MSRNRSANSPQPDPDPDTCLLADVEDNIVPIKRGRGRPPTTGLYVGKKVGKHTQTDLRGNPRATKFGLNLSHEFADWIYEQRKRMGPDASLHSVFEWLIRDQMKREETERGLARGKKREKKEARQQRWLDAVAVHYHVTRACQVTGISRAETDGWAEGEEDFGDRFDEARWIAIEEVERQLITGGGSKGQLLGLITFLNAHHPEYGRIKAEQLSRILGPLIKKFYKAAVEEAGEVMGEKIKARMEQIAEERLADFS